MKQLCICTLFMFFAARLSAQNIIAAEYFFDTDPGVGAGTPLAVGAPGATVNFSANIPTTSLTPGFHMLAIRAKDSNNKWGLLEWRTVYVSAAATNVAPIVAAEFFFDTDPGAGNGTGLGVAVPGHTVNFSAVIPTTSLQGGFHALVIRTRDANGMWGFFESRSFYLYAMPVDAPPVVAAEYFVDADPGPGNGTAVSVGASGNVVNFIAMLPTASLSGGFHTLSLRVKTADGKWGLTATQGFYLQPTTTNMTAITGAEYFLDADPGVGNGSSLSFTTPGTSATQNFVIPIPVGTPTGTHVIAIRAKDAAGVWGLFEMMEITVSGFPLPLNWLLFTAKRADSKIALQWKTANEVNTSFFDVERSGNGIDFKKIGEVAANGNGGGLYNFTDNNPLPGLNYYRIKQADNDGRFEYSVIKRVYFGDESMNTLRMFPQPARTQLNVVFGGKGDNVLVQVYDASGKMVLNERKPNASMLSIATNELAGGLYWIVVSDGIVIQKGQFIKQ